MKYKAFKRICDILLSAVGLIVSSPLLLVIVLAIKSESGGPAIFKQERLGRDGKVFMMYKFRSMRTGAEKQGSGQYSYKGDPRVTRVGQIYQKNQHRRTPAVC